MARVKVCNNQLTLPDEARQKLGVSEDDYLDVEVVENGVLLKPLTEREKAWERVFRAMESVECIGPEPKPGEDEFMDMVAEAIHAMRRDDGGSRSRRLGPGEHLPRATGHDRRPVARRATRRFPPLPSA